MGRKARLKQERRAARERLPEPRKGGLAMSRGLLLALVVAAAFFAALSATYLISRNGDSEPAADGTAVAQSASQGPVAVGKRFPDFDLTEAGGQPVTLTSLEGKPSIVWFTTSYCVPCQVGAREVAGLYERLGGQPFNVLVVFVDPEEPVSALATWRQRYGNEDWLVALDSNLALAEGVRLAALDTKFLLDERGVVRNVDLQVAGESYLGLIEREVERAT